VLVATKTDLRKADIFAAGLVVLELFGLPAGSPSLEDDEKKLLQLQEAGGVELVDLVNQTLHADPGKRISAEAALEHDVFRDIARMTSLTRDLRKRKKQMSVVAEEQLVRRVAAALNMTEQDARLYKTTEAGKVAFAIIRDSPNQSPPSLNKENAGKQTPVNLVSKKKIWKP
jgi:serine/threonine protein kinase